MRFQKIILIVFISFGFLTCCNEEDNENPNTSENHAIHGSWNLTNVSGGLIGINIDYNLGEVIWTFNDNNNQLVIENNIMTAGPEDIYAGLDSGNYSYEIQELNGTETLYISNDERGIILFLDTTLQIDDGVAADGFLTTFER